MVSSKPSIIINEPSLDWARYYLITTLLPKLVESFISPVQVAKATRSSTFFFAVLPLSYRFFISSEGE
ncbi:hypothetical protein VAE130_570239 [Vibrio aestuarianus]|nr:hypothetical protein VAE308_1050240 [Vibrio aestuarianus]CAH8193504.1 hypothetical protein VIBAE_A30834 [Vibrio aestuarianus subsp. francensis]CAH8193878.1 hypothetical protein VAE032_270237 [Vibrio aestuarianus]CAH8193963.1 hypothetical protein VAE128_460239 [Vibrio aestuarianus]CAH8194168.1 hypothetical protein VAE130_570239 [Vibrio aestuarianus]